MDDLMTLEEFAAAYRVPLNTARYWRSSGTGGPKTFKLGRRVFVRKADAEAWAQQCYESTTRDAS